FEAGKRADYMKTPFVLARPLDPESTSTVHWNSNEMLMYEGQTSYVFGLHANTGGAIENCLFDGDVMLHYIPETEKRLVNKKNFMPLNIEKIPSPVKKITRESKKGEDEFALKIRANTFRKTVVTSMESLVKRSAEEVIFNGYTNLVIT